MLTGYQVNELGNSPSIYISRYRSLKSFALMDNSSAFATNSSHVTYKVFLQSSFIYRELN